jgi:hypothetical protein
MRVPLFAEKVGVGATDSTLGVNPHPFVELCMASETAREVMSKIIDACDRHPGLTNAIFHFLFDANGLRPGLVRSSEHWVTTACGQREGNVMVEPSSELMQFAHAVSQGFMPEMALASAAVGD